MLHVLRLVTSLGETSAAYNQFTLARQYEHRVSICTYFPCCGSIPKEVKLFNGDGSVLGFRRTCARALALGDIELVHAHHVHVALGLILLLPVWFVQVWSHTVFTVHTSYQNLSLRNKMMAAVVFGSFRRIVFCGEASRRSFPSFFMKLAGQRARTIVNGVDLRRVNRVRQNVGWRSDHPPIIVCVGRLIESKRPTAILDACAQLDESEWSLVFIGDGPLRDRLVRRASELGVADRVQFTGVIAREDVFAVLCRASLFVSASLVEGMPIAPLEAMACGCPVLLSDIPSHREIKEDSECVTLVAVDDLEALTGATKRLCGLSAGELRKLGVLGRELVERRFSLDEMNARYDELYSEVRSVKRGQ